MQFYSDPFFWRERWRQLKLAHCAVPNYGNAKEFWADKMRIQTVYMKDHAKRKQSDTARLNAMKSPMAAASSISVPGRESMQYRLPDATVG